MKNAVWGVAPCSSCAKTSNLTNYIMYLGFHILPASSILCDRNLFPFSQVTRVYFVHEFLNHMHLTHDWGTRGICRFWYYEN
jgi:hypothetical protein